jgi:hypothetical protein
LGETYPQTFERLLQVDPEFKGTLASLAHLNGFGCAGLPMARRIPEKGETFLNNGEISCFMVPKKRSWREKAIYQFRFLLRNADDFLLLLSRLDSAGIVSFWYKELNLYKYRLQDIDELVPDNSELRINNEVVVPISISSLIQIVFMLYGLLMFSCFIVFLLEISWRYLLGWVLVFILVKGSRYQ